MKTIKISNKINPKIFKAYDIRGKCPSEINEDSAYYIGASFVKFLKKKNINIVVSSDNRFSSPFLKKKIIKGITDFGGNVVDIGLSSTPMFYFTVINFNFDGGINITASHNPSDYNGFKIVKSKAIPLSGVELKEIEKIANSRLETKKKKGSIKKKKVLKNYIKFNLEKVDLKKIKKFKIIVDTANGVSSIGVKEFFDIINSNVHYLFLGLDGSFPNHPADPVIKDNLKIISKEIKKRKADLGIAFDGDGDRIVFLDEKGKAIRSDLITALIAQEMLQGNPGQKILYEIRSSQIVKETIAKNNGIPVLGKAGHSLMKGKMRKENILFGGELSGHYFFQETGYTEAPLLLILKILKILNKENKKLSEIILPFQKYFQSGEINFKVTEKDKKIKEIENEYHRKAEKIMKIDGLFLMFQDWWFSLRISNTENLLRLNVEANSKKILNEKVKEISKLIK